MEADFKIEHQLKLANIYEEQGQILHASQIYHSIINEHFEFDEAYYRLAELYEKIGKKESGISLLTNYISDFPENIEARIFLSRYLLRNGLWEEAAHQLSFIDENEEPISLFFSGYAYLMMGDLEIAENKFNSFIRSEHENELKAEANLYLARINYHLNKYEKAMSYARNAVTIYPDHWELHLIIAKIHYQSRMLTAAADEIKKAIKSAPNNSESLQLAGKIYYELDDYRNAETFLLKSIETNDKISAENYYLLGNIYSKKGEFNKAFDYFDIAVKIDPGFSLAEKARDNAASKK